MKPSKDFDQILARIENAENWRRANFEDRWRDYYRRYRSRPKPKKHTDSSNIFVPYTFMQQRVIVPRITESLFANRPFVSVLPREDTDAEKARKMQTLLDWQFSERMNIRKVLGGETIENMATYGTGITHTGWLVKKRNIRSRQPIGETVLTDTFGQPLLDNEGQPIIMPSGEVVTQTATYYDDPYVQNIDLFDFFVDPNATCIDNARYCGHGEYQTREELDALEEQRGYKIAWKELNPESNIETGSVKRKSDGGIAHGEEEGNDRAKGGLYLVHHYWEDNRHVVIINRKVMALDEENPFWHGMKPYDKCCYISLPGEFYGLGIPEIVAMLQDELNTTRNQRIDYNTMAMRRMWKARKGSDLLPEDLRWRQGGIIWLNEMDDLAEINVQDLPASAFANEDRIKQDMRDATGCHDIIMGLANTDETATTTMTKDNNASIRFTATISDIVQDLLVRIAQKCVSLNQQFLTEYRAVRLLNEDANELFEVSPLELDGDYDLLYVGTSVEPMANKELTKERYLQVWNIVQGDPAYQSDLEARMRLLRELIKAMGVKDVDSLIPKPPQMPENIIGEEGGGAIGGLQGFEGQLPANL